MSNMSYCRFQNTLFDLRDCAENIDAKLENGGSESKARTRLVKEAFDMVKPFLIYAGGADMRMTIQLDDSAIKNLPVEAD